MDLKKYDVIKKIVRTDKSIKLFHKFGRCTFDVLSTATRSVVREAIEKIWSVKVERVWIYNTADKTKFHGRRPYKKYGVKRAIVAFQDGHSIDVPGGIMALDGLAGEVR